LFEENQTCSNPENSRNVLACSSCQMTVLNFELPSIEQEKRKKSLATMYISFSSLTKKKIGVALYQH